jgi:phosphate starvation-inducible protein PhoH
VVRHPLVQKIVHAYDVYESKHTDQKNIAKKTSDKKSSTKKSTKKDNA